MNTRSTFAKAGLAGVAGVIALAGAVSVPTFAAAQQAGYYDNRSGYYYDPCRRDTTQRSTTGGILGALAGAAVGSNVAGHHVRKEGAVLGALAGAAVGAGIGHSTAACSNGQSASAPPPPPAAQRQGYYGSDPRYYGSNSYDRRDYDRSRYDDRNDGDRYYGDRATYPVAERAAPADNCTLAESPIYLPDGRVQKRFVRVCQDANGRYQVVD